MKNGHKRYSGDHTKLIITAKGMLITQPPLHMPHFIFHKHTPFEQSREVVLVDAFLSDRAKVGGQQ